MKRLLKNRLIVKLIFLIVPAVAGAITVPGLQPAAYVSEYAGQAGTLGAQELGELSLYLSGAAPGAGQSYLLRLQELRKEFRETSRGETQGELAEEILVFMHEKLLTRYAEKQTRMDVLLEQGVFNCVSSAVLYVILALDSGLDVHGVKTSDHAFCRVFTPEGAYDVETTNPYGFNPGQKKQFTDEFGNITGFNYVPPGNYRDRRDITRFELTGLILQNRITFLTERHLYSEAAELGVDYWHLLQNQDAAEVMQNGFLNMWNVFNTSESFVRGIEFYDDVISQYGNLRQVLTNRDNLINNYMVTLNRSGRYREARAFLTEREDSGLSSPLELKQYHLMLIIQEVQEVGKTSYSEALALLDGAILRFGEDSDLLRLKATYVHNFILELIRSDELDRAYRLAGQYRSTGELKEAGWKELVAYVYQKKANSQREDFLAAAAILAQGLAEVGENSDLRRQYNAYINNYEVTVHNRMVELYNRQRFSDAQLLLEEALKEVPGSRRLQKDLDLVREVIAATSGG